MKKKINFLLAGLLLIISFSAVADEMRFQKPYIQLNGGISAGDGLGVSANGLRGLIGVNDSFVGHKVLLRGG